MCRLIEKYDEDSFTVTIRMTEIQSNSIELMLIDDQSCGMSGLFFSRKADVCQVV